MSNHALNHFQASEPVSLFAKHLTRFKNTSKMTPMVYTGSYPKLLWSSKMSNLVKNTCPKKQDQSGWHNKIRLCVFQKNNHFGFLGVNGFCLWGGRVKPVFVSTNIAEQILFLMFALILSYIFELILSHFGFLAPKWTFWGVLGYGLKTVYRSTHIPVQSFFLGSFQFWLLILGLNLAIFGVGVRLQKVWRSTHTT